MNVNKYIRKTLLFIIITYLFSWSIFIFANRIFLLMMLGSCAPSIIGSLFIIMSKSDTKKDFCKRIYNPKLIGLFWYVTIFFSMPLFYFLSAIILSFLGIEANRPVNIIQVVGNPALLFTLVIFSGLGAGVGEEFGWRGYLLDLLQKRFTPFVSSLIVGVIWSAWHIPLRILSRVNLFSVPYIVDFLMIVSCSLFITWIYNNNKRSILAAILAHCMINSSLSILNGAQPLSPYMGTLITSFIVVVLISVSLIYKPYSFFKNNSVDSPTNAMSNA